MQRTVTVDSQGQCGEVEILRKYLPEGPITYIDIGAGDPDSCSNTWAFYQQGGSGLLIEPLPTFWYRLLRLRPRDRLLPIAASNTKGVARLRACGPCSSMRPDWSIHEHANLLVETDTIENILLDYPTIRDNCQLCSIDVEGHEKQVLEGINWDTFHPGVIIVECMTFDESGPGTNLSAEWEPILIQNGYRRVAETAMNYIYTNIPAEEQ